MKKLIFSLCAVGALLISALALSASSYALQDGYRLQGIRGQGRVYKGFFTLVIKDEVFGVQGSKNGFIFGSTMNSSASSYFILHTKTGKIEWLEAASFYRKTSEYGCPKPDMSTEVNLAGLHAGHQFSSK